MAIALPLSLPSLALLPEAALALGADGRIAAASPPAAAMFRLDRVGLDLTALIADPARLFAAVDGLPVGDHVAAVPLEAAFDHAPLGMALFNTDGQYVRVNAALCALLGREAGELIGMRDQELTHPEDRASDVEAAERILRGELSTRQCEKRFV